MPTVSVAMPVFNGEAYIGQALECIADQSFRDIEVIVLDNASTDRTREIVQAYVARDPRFRLIVQPENKGAMPNFTDGLNAAKGEFFLWRAFDDLSDRRYIETLHDELVAHPHTALAFGIVRTTDIDGANERITRFPRLTGNEVQDTLRLMFKSHAGWFYGMWRRSDLAIVYGHVMKLYPHAWASDHLVLLPFLLQRKFAYNPDAVFHQRLKRTKAGPRVRSKVPLAVMRRLRSEFAHASRQLIATYGSSNRLQAAIIHAAVFG
jgi:glycosyltransferase involved in cell wall biosynthesis